jgi:hypothetical protein
MSCKKVPAQGFVKNKGMIAIAQQTFAPETFGKEWKWETNPVLRLIPGSHKWLALREIV